jgi:hypothetical protein
MRPIDANELLAIRSTVLTRHQLTSLVTTEEVKRISASRVEEVEVVLESLCPSTLVNADVNRDAVKLGEVATGRRNGEGMPLEEQAEA